MHIPEGQSSQWVLRIIPGRRAEHSQEPSAAIKPAEAQVQRLQPHAQASQAFEAKNALSLVGRGSLILAKFEKIIARIAAAAKMIFHDLMGIKPKPEPQVPLEKQLADVQKRKKALETHIENVIRNPALLGAHRNIRDAFTQLDKEETSLNKQEQNLKNDLIRQPTPGKVSSKSPGELKEELKALEKEKSEIIQQWAEGSKTIRLAEEDRSTRLNKLLQGDAPDDFDAAGKAIEALNAKVDAVVERVNLKGLNEKLAAIDEKIKEIKSKLNPAS